MNRTISVAAVILWCLSGHYRLPAQEMVTPLHGNPQVARYRTDQHRQQKPLLKSAVAESLELPVFDDFSAGHILPDPSIWSDEDAFVNNNFAVSPVTNGVATLDALDASGSIYPWAVITPATFVADHLTSHPVQLQYPPSDSIYLSFLFQAGGVCDLPEEQDSLMVDFFAPDSGRWVNVWRTPGTERNPFMHVMIPVTDQRFLVDGFRFRFRNRASLSRSNDYPDMRSNVDYWHLDYVRLDRNRTAADTVLRDVAFHAPLHSILKDLTSLPWSHFQDAYHTVLDPFLTGYYTNNDTITRNVTRSLSIHDPIYNETYIPGEPTAQDLPALEDTVVQFSYIYPFNFERGDSAHILFKAALRTDEFDPKLNDTVVLEQVFRDYYAYDDGTPEAGYGLRGGGTANGLVVMKYFSYRPDRLGGVYIHFNQVYDSLNLDYYFKLVVLDDNGGQPGSVIWEDGTDFRPVYAEDYPGFVKFEFSEPVQVSGTFYVGWRQYNEYLLNVGLDLNSKIAARVMYYNIQGSWQPSTAPGVMMLRPFIYDPTTGLDPHQIPDRAAKVYPNPAGDRFYFELPGIHGSADLRVEIFDTSGRLVLSVHNPEGHVDLPLLPAGIYHIRFMSGTLLYHSRIMINQ